jgi:hypothetical protein
MTSEHATSRVHAHTLARLALFGFILVFIVSRAFVFLIMSHQIPNFYFFVQGTHVHHLNYGIFLLAAGQRGCGDCHWSFAGLSGLRPVNRPL